MSALDNIMVVAKITQFPFEMIENAAYELKWLREESEKLNASQKENCSLRKTQEELIKSANIESGKYAELFTSLRRVAEERDELLLILEKYSPDVADKWKRADPEMEK